MAIEEHESRRRSMSIDSNLSSTYDRRQGSLDTSSLVLQQNNLHQQLSLSGLDLLVSASANTINSLDSDNYTPSEDNYTPSEDNYTPSEDNYAASEESQLDRPRFNARRHFIEQLSRGYFCSETEHTQKHKKSFADLTLQESWGIKELQYHMDPRANSLIPDVLRPWAYRGTLCYSTKKLQHKQQPDNTALVAFQEPAFFAHLYEGPDPRPKIDLGIDIASITDPTPHVTVDIDSVCGFPSSLAVFKKGIEWYPYTSGVSQITGKVHGIHIVHSPADEKEEYIAVDKVPHIHFGFLGTWRAINIYILFPRIYDIRRSSKDATTILTTAQQSVWYNRILYPALKGTASLGLLHEIPSTYASAITRARAASKEQGAKSQKGNSYTQLLRHSIKGEFLELLWEAIYDQIDASDPELALFADLRIFLNGKGMKLASECKSYTQLQAEWEAQWTAEINDKWLSEDSCWWDLGRQILVDSEHPSPDSLLWRRCCLERYWKARRKHQGGNVHCTVYPLAGLRDSVSMTITPSARSPEYIQGSRYSQFYSKSKVSLIVNTLEIFASQDINKLPVGKDQLTATSSAGGGQYKDLEHTMNHYVCTKARASTELEQMEDKAIAVREEHRLAVNVARSVINSLCEKEAREILRSPSRSPSPTTQLSNNNRVILNNEGISSLERQFE